LRDISECEYYDLVGDSPFGFARTPMRENTDALECASGVVIGALRSSPSTPRRSPPLGGWRFTNGRHAVGRSAAMPSP